MTRRIPASSIILLALIGCDSSRDIDELPERERAAALREITSDRLERFTDREFQDFFDTLRRRQELDVYSGGDGDDYASAAPDAEEAPGTPEDESITNNQEAGVDEGGIVKTHGDHLVVLRRGRLFTAKLGADSSMAPIDAIDAYAPGTNLGSWYDEMLIDDDRIIVIGYSYTVGATELGLFSIDDDGGLEYENTYFLRSGDYYSSRNYASRLVDGQLVFYMPYYLDYYAADPLLPAVGDLDGNWSPIIERAEIFRPVQMSDWPVLHTVVRCDLEDFSCGATSIVGPAGRTFYVSPDAVYLWVGGYSHYDLEEGDERILETMPVVYRLPLDGSTPGIARAYGMPTDQFSLSERNGVLRALVRAEGYGDAMWGPEVTAGDVGLVTLPLDRFVARLTTVPKADYRTLPFDSDTGEDDYYYSYAALQNRFIGDHVLYGEGAGWWEPVAGEHSLYVHDVADGVTTTIALPHGIDRIEVMGEGAVVIGADAESLHFRSVSLGDVPAVIDVFSQVGVVQGETRSHGFFYRSTGENTGVLGLPVRATDAGYEHLYYGSASVLYLSVSSSHFASLGELAATPSAEVIDDACVVSCTDWYGNARPIFYDGRTFALLGYELVEGRIADGAITEIDRANLLDALTRD